MVPVVKPSLTSGKAFAAATVIALIMPGAYMVESAGPVVDTTGQMDGSSLVTIDGAPVYDTDSTFLMTTVSAVGNPDVGTPGAHALLALFDPNAQLIPIRLLYPRTYTAAEENQKNQAAMQNSQDVAGDVALEMAGYETKMKLTVSGALEGGPAEGKLAAGDVLEKIEAGGETIDVHSFSDLSAFLARTAPGSEVKVTYRRGEESAEVALTTAAYEPDASGWVKPGSQLGIAVTVSDVAADPQVNFAVEGIGGPSAGLMFTIGIYDKLTPGSLAGEAKIAGTGTIAYNGDVGPIGGIQHKLRGAASAGATDFFAPALNCPETVGWEPEGMNIWSVRNASEAIHAAEAIGKGERPELPTCQDASEGFAS